MKVVCINNNFPGNWIPSDFIVGKVYQLLFSQGKSHDYIIFDNSGMYISLGKNNLNHYFRLLEDVREEKINLILED
jgi:hypothetical protein